MDDPVSGLSERAASVYEALDSPDADAARRSLMLEAARTVARLDELDSIIAGKGVLELMRFRLHESWDDENDRTVRVEVKFDNVLAEARQQAAALRQMVTALEAVRVDAKQPESTAKGEVNGLVLLQEELAKRRQSGASGSRRAKSRGL